VESPCDPPPRDWFADIHRWQSLLEIRLVGEWRRISTSQPVNRWRWQNCHGTPGALGFDEFQSDGGAILKTYVARYPKPRAKNFRVAYESEHT
jgi:hypothetical protein